MKKRIFYYMYNPQTLSTNPRGPQAFLWMWMWIRQIIVDVDVGGSGPHPQIHVSLWHVGHIYNDSTSTTTITTLQGTVMQSL